MQNSSTVEQIINFIEKMQLRSNANRGTFAQRTGEVFGIEADEISQRRVLAAQLENGFRVEQEIRTSEIEQEVIGKYISAAQQFQTFLGSNYWNSSIEGLTNNFSQIRITLLEIKPILKREHALKIPSIEVYLSAAKSIEAAIRELEEFVSDDEGEKSKLLRILRLLKAFFDNCDSMPLDDAIEICCTAIFRGKAFVNKNGNLSAVKGAIVGIFTFFAFVGECNSAFQGLQITGEMAAKLFSSDHGEGGEGAGLADAPVAIIEDKLPKTKPRE